MMPNVVIFSCAFNYDLQNLENAIDKIREEVIRIVSNRFLLKWPAKRIIQIISEFVNFLKFDEVDDVLHHFNKPGIERVIFTFTFRFKGPFLKIAGGFCIKSAESDSIIYQSENYHVDAFEVFTDTKKG